MNARSMRVVILLCAFQTITAITQRDGEARRNGEVLGVGRVLGDGGALEDVRVLGDEELLGDGRVLGDEELLGYGRVLGNEELLGYERVLGDEGALGDEGVLGYEEDENSSRQKRLLGPFRFGNTGYANNELQLVRNKVTSLLDNISEFERVRAKASSISKLQKVIKSLKDVCPPNTSSLRIGKKCFEHVTDLWMDYDSAFIYCNSRGGMLAQPDLENESYLKELREYFPSLGDNSVLIGITDLLQEGHFSFTDGTPASPHKFYEGKFPIYAEKDCVSLTTYKGFGLIDTDCKRLHEVLCEYNPLTIFPY